MLSLVSSRLEASTWSESFIIIRLDSLQVDASRRLETSDNNWLETIQVEASRLLDTMDSNKTDVKEKQGDLMEPKTEEIEEKMNE